MIWVCHAVAQQRPYPFQSQAEPHSTKPTHFDAYSRKGILIDKHGEWWVM
jgi:hypothetical protein